MRMPDDVPPLTPDEVSDLLTPYTSLGEERAVMALSRFSQALKVAAKEMTQAADRAAGALVSLRGAWLAIPVEQRRYVPKRKR